MLSLHVRKKGENCFAQLKSKMCAPPSRVWSNDTSFPRKRDGRLAGKHGQSPAGQARALQSVAEATGRDTARGHGFWGGTCHCRAVCSDVHSNSSSSALLLNSYDENNYTTYNTHTSLQKRVPRGRRRVSVTASCSHTRPMRGSAPIPRTAATNTPVYRPQQQTPRRSRPRPVSSSV